MTAFFYLGSLYVLHYYSYHLGQETPFLNLLFCRAGIIGFVPNGPERVESEPMLDPVRNYSAPYSVSSHLSLGSLLVLNHTLLRVVKHDIEVQQEFGQPSWVGFDSLSDHLETIVFSRLRDSAGSETVKPTVVYEPETGNNIRKVLIGGTNALENWLIKLIFLDAIQFLSNQQVGKTSLNYIIDL